MKTAQVSQLMTAEYKTSSDSLLQVFGTYVFSLDHQFQIIQDMHRACDILPAGEATGAAGR
jgi:hypothetical protein